MEHNPGIYFEKLNDLRIYDNQWRLLIYVDMLGMLNQSDSLHRYLSAIDTKCTSISNYCIVDSQIKLVGNRIHAIEEYITQIGKLTTLNQDKNEKQTIRQKRAPFEFIGKISKVLFGTLDSDDADYYNEQIDRVYKDTKHIAKLLEEQTNIFKSNIDRTSYRINELRNKFANITKAVETLQIISNRVTMAVNYNTENLQITSSLIQLDQCLNEYELDLNTIIDAIFLAKQGMIHPKIITPTELAITIKEIQASNPSIIFPTPSEPNYMEELIRISKVQVAYAKSRLIYILEIPLLTINIFNLYKLIPVPMVQESIDKNYAYITPAAPYLAITSDRVLYTPLTESQIEKCKETMGIYLCKRTRPLFHTVAKVTCEVNLLINPKIVDFTTCDIRVIKMLTSFWTQLTEPNTWIFSTSIAEPLHITCPNKDPIHVIINSTGVIKIAPKCIATSTVVTLTTTRVLESKIRKSYVPPIQLNITNLDRSLASTNLSEVHLNIPHIKPYVDTNDLATTGTKLSDIVNQAKEIAKHKRTEQRITNIHSVLHLTGLVIISLTILDILYKLSIFTKIIRLFSFCKRDKNRSAPTTTTNLSSDPIIPSSSNVKPEIILLKNIENYSTAATTSQNRAYYATPL
nr:PREDICTED: uncharacterized protein LOC105663285 [Megachile rotundata]